MVFRYKPRPSRSRSLKSGTQESVDHLMVPEKGSRTSKRRRTTPATTRPNNISTTPRKVQQICDMGFTPSTSIRALKYNNGDIMQSVDWLITNKAGDDELAPHASRKSKTRGCQTAAHTAIRRKSESSRTRHDNEEQVIAKTAATDLDAVERDATSVQLDINAHIDDNRSPTKVQVVIPTKLPKTSVNKTTLPETSRKKPKRRKTTSDLPDPAQEENVVPGEQAEKKQDGRCSKNVVKALQPTEKIQNNDEEALQKQLHDPTLQIINENVRSTTVQEQAIKHETTATIARSDQDTSTPQSEDTNPTTTTTSRSTPERSALPDRPEVEPLTPELVKKPVSRVQPSTNKGKIPYRVGLSKRARIAPLLRIVKK